MPEGLLCSLRREDALEGLLAAANEVRRAGKAVFRVQESCGSLPGERGDLFFPEEVTPLLGKRVRGVVCSIPRSRLVPVRGGKAALLMDHSYLWGAMASYVFERLRMDYEVVSADDVSSGALDGCDLLVVPGGWASKKGDALGKKGRAVVRRFVEQGGSYLGFCGGAGLALAVPGGLRLIPCRRKPAEDRLPNFSGSLWIRPGDLGHPVWMGLEEPRPMYVWWPSQFDILDPGPVRVLGRYGSPGNDLYVSDLRVEGGRDPMQWRYWEERYGINLDPSRLRGEPAILEGSFGEGKVLLSYVHLETPGSVPGLLALFNVWQYLSSDGAERTGSAEKPPPRGVLLTEAQLTRVRSALKEVTQCARAVRRKGIETGLWFLRNDWFLMWKRGVNGFLINTFFGLVDHLDRLCSVSCFRLPAGEEDRFVETMEELRRRVRVLVPEVLGKLERFRGAGQEGNARGKPPFEEPRSGFLSEYREEEEPFRGVLDCLDRLVWATVRGGRCSR